ncbi:MAG: type II toxin-antitoxin system HicB family antitoxin [Lachnospiraceae bacterium]|nr:type II toxin-antitoxin system HicB family antitoxin [Lachnospiraceae bacterium]
MTFTYPAVFYEKEDHTYEGYFPDFACSTVRGKTLDDAIADAIESLREWMRLSVLDGDEIPTISAHDQIELKEGQFIRNIAAIVRLYDGWDE